MYVYHPETCKVITKLSSLVMQWIRSSRNSPLLRLKTTRSDRSFYIRPKHNFLHYSSVNAGDLCTRYDNMFLSRSRVRKLLPDPDAGNCGGSSTHENENEERQVKPVHILVLAWFLRIVRQTYIVRKSQLLYSGMVGWSMFHTMSNTIN